MLAAKCCELDCLPSSVGKLFETNIHEMWSRCGRAVGVRLRESDDLREPTVLPSSEAVRSRSASSTIPAMSRLEQL